MKYRAEIDGLRAIAVVPVILFHADFELFSGGFVGVDVFFVISGYLITTILIEELENKEFSIFTFYERRARRILPALFFVILVCIPFAWMWMLPSQMIDFSQSIIAVSIFASNILFWQESGYFDAASEEKPLLHTWSLAVEEQYYVLFPIFLILTWRFGKNRVFWAIVLMAAVSLLLSEWGWRNKASANFYLAPTRAWELFAGSIAAFIVDKQGVQKGNAFAFLGLALIVLAIFFYDESTPFPSVYALVPVVGAVLVVVFADTETLVAKLLSTKALVGIGLVSYSAYLWHQPLFAFARIRTIDHTTSSLMLFLSGLSIVLAFFTWRFIEKPFRQSQRVTKKAIFIGSLIAVVSLMTFGYAGYSSKGFKSHLLDERQIAIIDSIERSKLPNCKHAIAQCLLSSDSSERGNIVLLGDSNAYHFSVGLQKIAADLGFSLQPLVFPGCLPLAEFYRLDQSYDANTRCRSFNRSVKAKLSELNERVDVIIVSAAWLLYFYGSDLLDGVEGYSGIPAMPDVKLSLDGENKIGAEEREEIFSLYFKGMFAQLSSSAKKVIVVGPLPPSIVRFDSKFTVFNPKLIAADQYFESISSFSKVFDNALGSNPVYGVDLASELCGEGVCEVLRNDRFLYGDPTHLSHFGQSTVIVPLLEKLLR